MAAVQAAARAEEEAEAAVKAKATAEAVALSEETRLSKCQAHIRRFIARRHVVLALASEGRMLAVPGTVAGKSGWYETMSPQKSKVESCYKLLAQNHLNEWRQEKGPLTRNEYLHELNQEQQ